MTRDELLRAFEREEADGAAYWNAFDTAAFFRPIGGGWSPAETVRHLNKSTRPVIKALGMPKLLLRVLFGRARRPSMTFDQLRARYLQLLAEGGQAGRFAPSSQSEPDLDVWRRKIMIDFARLHADLRTAIAQWPDPSLERLQMPHPLLGKLTVREMLMFTLYHQQHHAEVVRRKLR
jgi:hypothetical protein